MRRLFYITLGILFLIFICILSASTSGYYEYTNSKKTEFTESKIKEFEKDIENGKNININNYIKNNNKDYSNKITRLGDSISDFIFNSVNFVLKGSFKLIEKMLN